MLALGDELLLTSGGKEIRRYEPTGGPSFFSVPPARARSFLGELRQPLPMQIGIE